MLDAVVISDIHLGNRDCRHRQIFKLLEWLRRGRIATRRVVFLGDIFDSDDFGSWRPDDYRVLGAMQALAARNSGSLDKLVRLVAGNHDGRLLDFLFPGHASAIFDVIGSGDAHFLLHHGHRFDEWFWKPKLVAISEWGYGLLRRLDPTQTLSRLAKYASERWVDDRNAIEEAAVREAWKWSATGIVCGHTHEAMNKSVSFRGEQIQYANCGSFTQLPCTFVTIGDGKLRVEEVS